MSITKIQKNAFPASIDLSNVDLTIGAGEVTAANLHSSLDLTGKTITNMPGFTLEQTSSLNTPGLTYYTNNWMYLRGGTNGTVVSDNNGENTIQIGEGYIRFETNDGTTKMYINSTGDVGIGTASPSHALDIERATGAVGIGLQARDNSSSAYINFGDNNDDDVGQIKYQHSDDKMLFRVNAGSHMSINSSGNVGIGTTNAIHGLDVRHDTGSVANFETSASSTYAGIQLKNGTGVDANGDTVGYIYSYNASTFIGGLKFVKKDSNSGEIVLRQQVNGTNTDVVTISDGNVGIGTNSPAYNLDLLSTASGYITRFKTSGNYGGVQADAGSSGSAGGGYFSVHKNGTRAGLIGTTGAIKGANENNLGISADTGYQMEFFTNGSATPKAVIDTSGNVGIGDAVPLNKLHVNSGISSDIMRLGNSNGDFVLGYTTNRASIDLASTADIRIRHGSLVSTTIKSSGRVGIGTNSPDRELEIYNASPAQNTGLKIHNNSASHAAVVELVGQRASSGQDHGQLIFANGTKSLSIVRGVTDGYTNAGRLEFMTATSAANVTQRMTIAADGQVGIGTTNPSHLLHVKSGTTNIGAKFESTDGLGGIMLADNNGNVELVANGNNFEVRPAGGVASLAVTSSGSTQLVKSAGTFTVGSYDDDSDGFSLYGNLTTNNHADSLWAMNARLSPAGGSANHNFQVVQDHSQIGTAGIMFAGNGHTHPNNILFFANATGNQGGNVYNTNTDYRMRLNGGGSLFITSDNWDGGLDNTTTGVKGHYMLSDGRQFHQISANSGGSEIMLVNNVSGSGHSCAILQYRTLNAVEGTIQATSSGLAISNASDYRRKQNVSDLTGSLTKITGLRPVTYNLRPEYGNSAEEKVGFIAHEVDSCMPGIVTGTKDAVDSDGNAVMQSVSYSDQEMIATLVGAIKEQQTIIDDLKARIEALET